MRRTRSLCQLALSTALSGAALSATMVIVAPAHAQQGAAVLTGKVIDASTKKGITDVVVTVTSPALQGEQIVTTDSSGTYRIPSLAPGVYTMHLDKEGYRAYQRDQIQLRADATIRFDADLLPEGLKAEEVVVVAHSPTVDVGSTTSGASINSDFSSRIPVTNPGAHGGPQRSFESVAEAAPGASADLYGTSINGTSSPENSYVIDGLRTNNSKFGTNGSSLSIEFVKEVNVLAGGYMPEYGRSTGGILNVVTKSGSNEYHGSVFANWTPGALEGARKFPYFDGTAIQTRRTLGNVYDIGFDQSGPIVKDKLWYYVGFDVARAIYNIDRSIYANSTTGGDPYQVPGTNQRYYATSTGYQLFAKLDYRINQNNKLALTFAATPSTAGGDGDYSVDPSSGHVENAPAEYNLNGQYLARASKHTYAGYDTILKWTTDFDNKSKNLETTVGWHHQTENLLGADGFGVGSGLGAASLANVEYRRTPNFHSINDFENVPGCSGTSADGTPICPVNRYFSGGPGQMRQDVLDSYNARSILTILAQAAGHHVIKAGAEIELSTAWSSRMFSGGRRLRETKDGSSFDEVRGYGYLTQPDSPVAFDRFVTRTHNLNVGGFIQDSWSIMDKITLNAGVRYDNQFMFGADGKLFMSLPNQLSPRVGVIFDPTQNGRAKLFASYARFYQTVATNILDRGTGESQNNSNVNGPPDCDPRDASQLQGVCRGAARVGSRASDPGIPDRKYSPYSAGKTVVDPDLSPQSLSEFSAGGEYEIVKNGRFGVSYVRRWMNNVIDDMSNDEGATFFIGNPGKGIASGFPTAVRDYDAGTFYFTKTFADEWLAQVSYTLSWLRGNSSGLYRPENGQLDPNSNSTFDLKSLLANQTGDLPGDHRHSLKVFGAKDFKVTKESVAQLGASFQAMSGSPTNYLGSHKLYGEGEAYILPRGSGDRLPWNASMGTHVGYQWRFENGMSLGITMDIFNLLNFQGTLATDQNYTRTDVTPIAGGSRADLPDNLKRSNGAKFDPKDVNPAFGKATLYQEPRQFRFGIRGSF